MKLFPRIRHTIVSEVPSEEIIKTLIRLTKRLDEDTQVSHPIFTGLITNDHFRISLYNTTPQNSIPLASGKLETTSKGTIIFLKLQLFPAAKTYLWVSSFVCLFLILCFLVLFQAYLFASVAFFSGFCNYLILVINFQRKAKQVIKEIENILPNH